MKNLACRAMVVGLVTATVGFAARPTFRGEDEATWQIDGSAVIIAEVREIAPLDEIRYKFEATLVPRAALSGDFDPGLHPELHVTLHASGSAGASAESPPSAGDIVIAVIRPVNGKYVVPIDACSFMPENWAIVTIRGFDDDRIKDVLSNIQTQRAKGRATGAEEQGSNQRGRESNK